MDSKINQVKHELSKLRLDHEQLRKRIEHLEKEVKSIDTIHSEQSLLVEEKEASFEQVQIPEVKEVKQKTPSKKGDLELKIGGTWLNRIGVVAVIFGLSYFLKFSFDNEWIGPTGRIILGILLGMVLLGAGEKLRSRYFGYAQGLMGGGSLALFFSVFASYQFYELIPATFAFIFLVLVMILTVFMAVRHQSLPIGILGIIGGYLTPFMIGSDDPSLWILFSYLGLLTAGVLAVSIYQKWHSFQYLSFFFNQVIFMILLFIEQWDGLGDEAIAPFLVFLIYNFILYLGIATLYNILQKKKATRWDITLILLNAATFFGFSTIILEDTFMRDYLGFYAILLAVIYLYLGKLAYQLFQEDKSQVYSLFLASFVLITIAIPLQLSDLYIPVAWLAEAVGLTYLAKKLNIKNLYTGSLVVLALGLVTTWEQLLLLSFEYYDYSTFLLNGPTMLFILSIVALTLITKLTDGVELFQTKIKIQYGLLTVLLTWILFGLTVENSHFFFLQEYDFFFSPEQLSLSTIWLIYALILFVFGIRKKNRHLRYAALGLISIVILKAFFVDLANLATIYKIVLCIILGLFLLGISYFYQKKKDDIQGM